MLNVSLRPGDVYCPCTDGFSEQVSYERLRDRLSLPEPQAAVAQLLMETLAAGGHDNATVAVTRIG